MNAPGMSEHGHDHTHDGPIAADHTHEAGEGHGPVAVDTRAKLAVWKFASCDGCQLSILNCEDELLQITEAVHIAYFPEATRAVVEGPYELSLVEGSITTEEDVKRIHEIRAKSGTLVTIGACATAGGIQALKNWADVDEFRSIVYAHPEYLSTLDTSTPIASHVDVDYELRGCPVDKRQLVEVLAAFLNGRKPRIPSYSVCVECKLKGNVCVPIATGQPCLGPVTQAGCGALCPTYARGCYGCFGPQDSPNTDSLTKQLTQLGMSDADVVRVYRTFNAGSPEFRAASDKVAAGMEVAANSGGVGAGGGVAIARRPTAVVTRTGAVASETGDAASGGKGSAS